MTNTTINQSNNTQGAPAAMPAASITADSGIYFALAQVQSELRAPKDATNNFGGYNYRSAESILTKVKPLLAKVGLAIVMNDEVVQVGDRYYIKATATVIDCNTGATVSASALARESLDRKGSDQAQVTGACSSYARKYALGGLFGISDAADDPDSRDNRDQGHGLARPQQQNRGGQQARPQQARPVQQAAPQTMQQAAPQTKEEAEQAASAKRIQDLDRVYKVIYGWPTKRLEDQVRQRYSVKAVGALTAEQAAECADMLERCQTKWAAEAGKQKGAA